MRLPPALRHRDFNLFFGGQLVSLIGTWMQVTAQGWLVYTLTHSALLLGTVAAASALPGMVFTVWGGAVADRYNKRVILLITQTLMCLQAFALAALVFSGVVQIWHIVALAFLQGIAVAVDTPTRQAFIIELVGKEGLASGIAINSSTFNASRVMGPAVAGLVVARWGTGACFALNGVSFFAVIGGLLVIRPPLRERPPARALHREILEGVRFIRREPAVRGLIQLLAATSALGWSCMVLMPVFASDVLHAGPKGYGFLMAATGIGAFMGAVALSVADPGSERTLRRRLLGGVLLFCAALVFFAWSRRFEVSLAILVVAGWAMITYFATSNTWLQLSLPDDMRGRVMGVYHSMYQGFVPLGSLLAGALAERFGAPWEATMAAAACAVAALLVAPQARERRSWESAA